MSTLPRSRSTDRRFYGVAEGIVTDNNDPDKEGRVRVRFPWFDNHMISEWCRVLQPYAGNGYGSFFIPEIGDEVIVSFTHGDLRLPIILGGIYNGQDKPPSARDGANRDEKLIRTKAGHQILLNDSNDKHQVSITTNGGHSADLNDQDQAVTIKTTGGHVADLNDQDQAVTVKTTGGQQVVLDDRAGSVTVKSSGGTSIVLEASGTVTISGAMISIEGQNIQLGGAAAVEQLLLGTAFVTLFNTHVHTTTAPTLPTSPPIVPLVPTAVLSNTVKTAP
jgi:phage baseplate assembly protein V